MRCRPSRGPIGVVSFAVLVMGGCGTQDVCERRPWECSDDEKDDAAGEGDAGSCDAHAPPAYADLTETAKLPDPFLFSDGTRMSREDQWSCRRAEVSAQAQEYELGASPGDPDSVSGSLSGDALEVTVRNDEKSIAFSATITYPSTGTAPYPAMIGIGGISLDIEQLDAMGVATIIFPNDSIAEQKNGSSRGKGQFYELYGEGHSAGAMMAWAWGVGRLIDALEDVPEADIDPARLGVTGCSRNGKGALIVGAFEERIVLTIPQESGAGGAACWRISDVQKADGGNVQTLSQITDENVWFTDSFDRFGGSAERLPFDHHMIQGLVAPRALLVIENTWQEWLGNVSTYNCSMAAHRIWEALGASDAMGVSQVGSSTHCGWTGKQQPEVSAYVQKYLLGDEDADTAILKTDGDYGFDEDTWVDWTVPELE